MSSAIIRRKKGSEEHGSQEDALDLFSSFFFVLTITGVLVFFSVRYMTKENENESFTTAKSKIRVNPQASGHAQKRYL